MKIRLGFVSNSSSSSFTCCISGVETEVYDEVESDTKIAQCIKGHVVLSKYIDLVTEAKTMIDKLQDLLVTTTVIEFVKNTSEEDEMEDDIKKYYPFMTLEDADLLYSPIENLPKEDLDKLYEKFDIKGLYSIDFVKNFPSFRCPICKQEKS
jgi:hypothetical protein